VVQAANKRVFVIAAIQKALLASAFLFAFLTAGARAEESHCKLPLGAGSDLVKVAHVVDGDTLAVSDGRKLRLQGINAPEVAHGGHPADPLGEEAKQNLARLAGASVRVWVGAEAHDRYGRTLATIFSPDGENLNARMVREGMAYHISFPPELTYIRCYKSAEVQARARRAGVWQQPNITKAAENRFKGGFGLVEGVVTRVDHTRAGHWVNLDGDFAFYVRNKDAAYFPQLQLSSLIGKRVLVRGWVIDRSKQKKPAKSAQKRWMIKLQHASALELLDKT